MNWSVLSVLADLVPVELARPDQLQSHRLGGWLWVILMCGAAFALAIGALVTHLAWRDARRHQPAERAFVALAHRLKISRTDRIRLHDLASAASMPSVSLIVSETAFDRALAHKHANAPGEGHLRELRVRLFGEASRDPPR